MENENRQPDPNEQIVTVQQIEKTLREKVEELIPVFESMPPAQTVTSTQGEQYLKPNPAIAEIRSIFRDYCAVAKTMKDLSAQAPNKSDVVSIDAIRKKLKIAK